MVYRNRRRTLFTVIALLILLGIVFFPGRRVFDGAPLARPWIHTSLSIFFPPLGSPLWLPIIVRAKIVNRLIDLQYLPLHLIAPRSPSWAAYSPFISPQRSFNLFRAQEQTAQYRFLP